MNKEEMFLNNVKKIKYKGGSCAGIPCADCPFSIQNNSSNRWCVFNAHKHELLRACDRYLANHTFKGGDWAYHVVGGWFKLSTAHSFLPDGRRFKNDKNPTIYKHNPFDPDDNPPVQFKEGEVVVMSTGTGIETIVRFSHVHEGSFISKSGYSHPKCRKLNDEELGK